MPKSDGKRNLRPPWRKGQSGNPKGRVKRAYLEAMRALAEAEDRDAPAAIEVIKYHLRKMNLHCAQDVLNRAYGSAKQSIDMGSDGPVLRIILGDEVPKPP